MNKKISDKDKKDWENFISGEQKVQNKDLNNQNFKKSLKNKSIDLHGYTLENANKTISDFINKCFLQEVAHLQNIFCIHLHKSIL